MRYLLTLCIAFAALGCDSSDDDSNAPVNNGNNANNTSNNSTGGPTNNTNAGNNAQNNSANQSNGSNNNANNTTGNNATNGCGDEQVVRFQTSDGVEIVADYHPSKSSGRGAVVLLHMIPPSNDRTSWPLSFRRTLAELDVSVLSIDRRGAGDSGGTAEDAYTGDTARLDVEAAVRFITSSERACAAESTNLLLIGASNGTTSVLDYTVNRSDSALPDPKAIAWLSPGTYTESQNTIADHEDALKALPLMIVYPSSEPWSNDYADFSTNWELVLLEGGAHGTRNFDNSVTGPIQIDAIVNWTRTHLVP